MPTLLNSSETNQRYVFERMDGTLLKKEPLDSGRFIEFHELDTVRSPEE